MLSVVALSFCQTSSTVDIEVTMFNGRKDTVIGVRTVKYGRLLYLHNGDLKCGSGSDMAETLISGVSKFKVIKRYNVCSQ